MSMETSIAIATNAILAPSSSSARCAGKYLIFSLVQEEFGVRAVNIKEIMGMQEITRQCLIPLHMSKPSSISVAK
jgi:chemotaxis signal transduction protein